jgi:hypothetical protein
MSKKKKTATLTLGEFLKLAADRGVQLWTIEERGALWITNGSRRYPFPLRRREYLSVDLAESLCRYFNLPYLDFALDPREED